MTSLTNRALWQDAQGAAGVVRGSSVPTPSDLGDHKVLVKVHSWAINPCDYMLQDRDMSHYPVVLGCDVAGTVEAIASNSAANSQFNVGDRVFGFSFNNAFQNYVTLEDKLMARIPDSMQYRDAVVFGLCCATSAMFLFGKNYLHLQSPQINASKRNETILVWGGSSAVGSNAIQLAQAAGYDVISTCSKRNFDYVKGLGAAQVFDYNDPELTENLAAELDKGTCIAIFMAAGLEKGNLAALKVAAASKQRIKFASSDFIRDLDDVPDGVDIKQLSPGEFVPFPDCWFETTHATFGGYLPEALAKGIYKVAPTPLIVNKKGLEGIQQAIDMMRTITKTGKNGFIQSGGDGINNRSETTAFKLVVEQPLSP